jgi:hypothetical protein
MSDGINRILRIIRSILLSCPTPGFVFAPFAPLREASFPLAASTGTTLLDIAPNLGIMRGGSNDVATSEDKESEVLGS